MVVNSSQASAGAVPFWDLAVDNADTSDPFDHLQLYGLNYFFQDNAGGANAALSGGNTFQAWWCPSAITQTAWNDEGASFGPFVPANADAADGRIMFRVLDTGDNVTADEDFGTLCLLDFDVFRFDLSQMSVVTANLYNATMDSATHNTSSLVDVTAAFASGVLTLTPSSGVNLAMTDPGDTNNDLVGDPSSVPDNYPCTWNQGRLYQITMDLSAPAQADADDPMDVFWLGADTATNELICMSYVTALQDKAAFPTTGTPQTYHAFFYSNNVTNSAVPQAALFRPRFMVGSNDPLDTGSANTGAISIHNMKVHEVSF
jgi:hypothetical protein